MKASGFVNFGKGGLTSGFVNFAEGFYRLF